MAKFTVAIAVLVVLVGVGRCRFAGGSLGQLSGVFGQLGPRGGEYSALKTGLLETKSNGENHGTKGDNNGFSKPGYWIYGPGTQEPDGDSKERDSSNDDTEKYLNSFNEERRNKRLTDNASFIPPDKFIMAGSRTGLGQYPWVVHLDVKGHTCGGSLISSRHVITAAHCLDFQVQYYEQVEIYLAEYNTRTFPTDCVGRYCIQNFMVHPDKITIHQWYQPGIWHNDIAMMRLRGSAPDTDYIRPIPLPTFNINDARYEGTPLIVTGWGGTEYGQASAIKLHAQVQLVAPNTCRRHHPVTEGMLCAASRTGQGICFGDSGGPIMVEHGGQLHLAGLTSFLISDCGAPVPSMYTNVYSYLNWIQNVMRH